jgi:hypothetical protein
MKWDAGPNPFSGLELKTLASVCAGVFVRIL